MNPARRLRSLATGPPKSDDEKLAELRELLVGPEQARLARVEEHLSADALGKALPAAAVESQKHGEDLAWALRPAVMAAIRDAVKNDPHLFVDALVPVMGPAIRKAATHALRSLVQQLNETLARGLSLRGLRWRLEAARTGRPFAEVVVLRSLVYRVEQVFLVHRESGLVLHHLVAPGSPPQDPDQVAAMLSAIDAFVHDAFREEARLARFHVGELVGWVEHGPMAVLVAVVRGTAPDAYGDVLREVQERVHLQFRQDLSSFRGEVELFEQTESLLQRCLQHEAVPAGHPGRKRFYSAVALAAVAVAVACGIAWNAHRERAEEQRFARYSEALKSEPGVLVTEARRSGHHYTFAGLRDPLAPPPERILGAMGLAPQEGSFSFEPFYSLDPQLTEQRARAVLAPPPEVSLSVVNGDTLVARGRAPRAWIERARMVATSLPAVTHFETRELRDIDAEQEITRDTAFLGQAMVLFALGSAEITADQLGSIEAMARAVTRVLARAPDAGRTVELTLMGHTDARGAESRNQTLSTERAERVERELIRRGVPVGAVRILGAGVFWVPETEACEGVHRGSACARRVDFRVELR